MRFRTTGILAAILAVLVVIVYFGDVKRSEKKKKIEEVESKVIPVEPDSIREIYIRPSGIRLVKEGDEWNIVEPVHALADKSAVQGITGTFRWAKRYRAVASDSVNFATFGLDPPKHDLIVKHDKGVDTLHIGDKTPTGSYVFARVNREDTVFTTTTTFLTHAEKTLYNLRDKRILPFEKADVNSFTLKNANGMFKLAKTGGEWQLQSPIETKADRSKVDDILNRVRNGRAKEFVEEEPTNLAKYGLTSPSVQLDLILGGESARKTLLIGKPSGSTYYAKDDGRPPVFTVDSTLVSKLMVSAFDLRNKKMFNFLSSEVDSLILTYPASRIVCAKDTANQWQVLEPEVRKAKSWRISGITGAVSGAMARKFVAERAEHLARYKLDRPSIRAQLYKDGALLADLRLGKSSEDGVYALASDSGPVVLLDKSVFDRLKLTLEDIAEPKPKEEPEKTTSDSTAAE